MEDRLKKKKEKARKKRGRESGGKEEVQRMVICNLSSWEREAGGLPI